MIQYTTLYPFGQTNPAVGLCMWVLERSIDETLIQRHRILEDLDAIHKGGNVRMLRVLFADIHFFLIANTTTMKSLTKLVSLTQGDVLLASIRKKYLKDLEHLDAFRDTLEHLENNAVHGLNKKGQPLSHPGDFGNLLGEYYSFGGSRFHLSSALALFVNLQKEVQAWNDTRVREYQASQYSIKDLSVTRYNKSDA